MSENNQLPKPEESPIPEQSPELSEDLQGILSRLGPTFGELLNSGTRASMLNNTLFFKKNVISC